MGRDLFLAPAIPGGVGEGERQQQAPAGQLHRRQQRHKGHGATAHRVGGGGKMACDNPLQATEIIAVEQRSDGSAAPT